MEGNKNLFEPERREFVRVKKRLPVRYKFLARTERQVPNTIFEGFSQNIGGGGMLLVGILPDQDLTMDLLTHKVVIGVNVELPGSPSVIKALTRVAWIEVPEGSADRCFFGLTFKEIAKEHLDEVTKFIIKAQMG